MPPSAEQKEAARERQRIADYRATFMDGGAGERVLRDLGQSCGFMADSMPEDGNGFKLAHNEGQRSVFIRILAVLKLTPAQINALVETEYDDAVVSD